MNVTFEMIYTPILTSTSTVYADHMTPSKGLPLSNNPVPTETTSIKGETFGPLKYGPLLHFSPGPINSCQLTTFSSVQVRFLSPMERFCSEEDREGGEHCTIAVHRYNT